ncbi:hypothetical protein OG585_55455 (plasmid) [Streptomyces sp. NBC_01340]|uniref:hypothetical protein n=1 Tax=Streptomyces sp. NBC_01340 TaxID=2903830 RepID=UPI002E0F6BBC|nr:hypothetical protein OG585_00025 [Streptomyces sp. NBC_01340]WSI43934.1 hypothetical protein OG585_46895 [Streptomyces sp. NBC_01340]WSI45869.1 hypothetical protein OG585_55455 [Streptomyces sp. NBC_01340]
MTTNPCPAVKQVQKPMSLVNGCLALTADGVGDGGRACQDLLVECDVCGRTMRRWRVPPTAQEEQFWSCPWCHAATHVGGEWFEIARPPYLPMEMRWEKAVADGLPVDVSHAFDIINTSLCGIQEDGMSPSDHWWLPERENACGACREAAVVIDERWPQAMRGENARVSVARRPGARQ